MKKNQKKPALKLVLTLDPRMITFVPTSRAIGMQTLQCKSH